MSPSQEDFLKYFNDCIEFASQNEMLSEDKTNDAWVELLSFTPDKSYNQKVTSANLLKNINWNQTWPYNAQCPADAAGINGHVPVGCVATAMLHVMKYYNWPPSGEGSKYHSSWMNGGYGNININFASQTYDWYSMPNEASSRENAQMAKINYHAGVAVSMMWGPDGSGSQTDLIETALEDYFKYSTATQYVSKDGYTETNWKNMIKAQIDAKKPIVYSGTSTTTGHAWNCDGYQDDSFHMNWGWGGAGNGYYTLDNLTSTATVGGPENNFNIGQEAIINIYPRETSYPTYCSGTKTITGSEGAFDDGSSIQNYQANSSCVYVIKPTCGAVVSAKFNDFVLGDGDDVMIYDGDQTSEILLKTYDSANLPGSEIINSSYGALTVRFNTNATTNTEGWNLSYEVKNCKTNIIYDAPSGSFGDGSGTCQYSNSTVCSWYIQPTDAAWITINFDEFDVVGNIDYVKVFKTDLNTSNLVATYDKNNAPPASLSINNDIAVIQFFADGSTVGDGWNLNYTSTTSDIEENILLSNFSVMPNPGNGDSRLVFSLTKNSETTITITNLLGEIIATQNYNLDMGLYDFSINDITKTNLNGGVYIISIESNKETKTQKFVVLE
jgi:hypothetical protein